MARFNAENIDNYGGLSNGNKTDYFSLKNDRDVARVRFMYEKADEIEGYSVHKVGVGINPNTGRPIEKYINCLREYNEPLDKCPFCRSNIKLEAKMFIPLYNEDTQTIQLWERGKKFYSKISSICARYNPAVSHIFEIERNGAPGDTATTYEIFEVGNDNTRLADLPELPSIVGDKVLDKTAQEMEDYLEIGSFPDNSGEQTSRRSDDMPVRRRSSDGDRRTPTRRGDAF